MQWSNLISSQNQISNREFWASWFYFYPKIYLLSCLLSTELALSSVVLINLFLIYITFRVSSHHHQLFFPFCHLKFYMLSRGTIWSWTREKKNQQRKTIGHRSKWRTSSVSSLQNSHYKSSQFFIYSRTTKWP